MRIQIDKIKINAGRREALPEHIEELAKSIAEIGLLNPITIDRDYTLIAGLHRLEAAKSLGWTDIECTVSTLEGLQAELAEIDENFVRRDLSAVDFGDLLLRRKEIYETLHPETRVGISQAAGMNRAVGNNVAEKMSATLKPFVEDTATKLGVTPRTVRRQIQAARNLTPEAKELIRHTDIPKETTLRLSRLAPNQQAEAASLLVSGKIKSIDEYLEGQTVTPTTSVSQTEQTADASGLAVHPAASHSGQLGPNTEGAHKEGPENVIPDQKQPPTEATANSAPVQSGELEGTPLPAGAIPGVPYSLGGVKYASIKESVADLKNPNKDCSSTPDSFLAEITEFVRKFQQEIDWFHIAEYEPVFPGLTQVQFEYFQQQMNEIHSAVKLLSHHVQKGRDNHE